MKPELNDIFNIELVDTEDDGKYKCFMLTLKCNTSISFFVSVDDRDEQDCVMVVPGELTHTRINPADDGCSGMPSILFSEQDEEQDDTSYCIVKRFKTQYYPKYGKHYYEGENSETKQT